MPGAVVDNFTDSCQFYGNKVLQAKIESHTNWYKILREIMTTTREYVKGNFATGLAWNPKGNSISEFLSAK